VIEAVYFDLGDTLVSEETTVYDSSGQAITASVIEGAFEALEAIKKDGYRLGMIANGGSANIRSIIGKTGLEDYFNHIVISEEVGVEKPYQKIFDVALAKLGVKPEDSVMIGNNIDADILGANRVGMKSVWFKWNARYKDTIDSNQEKPDFIINRLSQLPSLIASMRAK